MHAGSLLVSTLLATLQSGYLAGLVIAPLLRHTLPDVDGTEPDLPSRRRRTPVLTRYRRTE